MRIDSHHHFWHYDPASYGWIDESMSVLRRDFLPEHLQREITLAGVDGVVSVQARQSLWETVWLLELSASHDFIQGVVGWVDLTSARVGEELGRFAANPKLKSVRHVIQDEPEDDFILREDFNRGIRELGRFPLAFDILILARHLPQAIRFVSAHPDQIFVLDHAAKPRIATGAIEPWDRDMRELAKRPNVYCKLSGLATEAPPRTLTEVLLRPYFESVLDAFGPRRIMFGSDWPVCLVACDYLRWSGIVAGWLTELSPDEQASILGGTATEVYRL